MSSLVRRGLAPGRHPYLEQVEGREHRRALRSLSKWRLGWRRFLPDVLAVSVWLVFLTIGNVIAVAIDRGLTLPPGIMVLLLVVVGPLCFPAILALVVWWYLQRYLINSGLDHAMRHELCLWCGYEFKDVVADGGARTCPECGRRVSR